MPNLVEIGNVVLQKMFFLNLVNVFSPFRNYIPLEKGGALHLNKLESWIPFTQGCYVPSLVEIGHVRDSGEEEKDKYQPEKLIWAFG